MISKANFELLLREGRSFEEYFRFEQEQTAAETEEKVVGPGMTMPPGPDNSDNSDNSENSESPESPESPEESPAPSSEEAESPSI